ncbi:MAG: acetyl-CoA hydrolase [Gammaproteobacteria bacterium]|nr:acetyl-CoA hydrolase [Gammaproteobacteria bacterium]
MSRPLILTDIDQCVSEILARVGKRVVVGTPLGIGKPNHLVNALYRRACSDSSIRLTILTALSLNKPAGKSDLERRFLAPFVERLLGDYPDLDYLTDLERGALPANVEISEFYFKSGNLLGNAHAQQHYVSSNYTHVVRDMLAAGVNVILQMVASRQGDGRTFYSLSGNPDLTLDILPPLRTAEKAGRKIAVVGLVNNQLPYMHGDAEVDAEFFDLVVDNPRYAHHLFAVPSMAIDPAEHMIGLYASTLVMDGGTLQVGIGNLGDAFVYATQLRHAENPRYLRILEQLGVLKKFAGEIQALGGTGVYKTGLYAGSEMFSDGLLHLYRAGIVKRRVYDDDAIQELLSSGKITEHLDADTLPALLAADAIRPTLTAENVAFLKRFGILRPDVRYDSGFLLLPDGARLTPDLNNAEARRRLNSEALGARLAGGVLLHGAFFLGSNWFYDQLRGMPDAERRLFSMTAVSKVNEIFSDVELEQTQHRHSRFLNICMKMTLLGAAASDTLAGGQVVSGVGGQYNFVAMAHALKEARSVLMLKSTRREHGHTVSNLVWDYAQCTIPRHLRDIAITEYGVADLRGKQDWAVIAALLNICDSQFQNELLAQAKAAGKIMSDYRIPEIFRHNTPDKLHGDFKAYLAQGLFPAFPFGSDFTPEELVLGQALLQLKQRTATLPGKLATLVTALFAFAGNARFAPYLKRMGFENPATFSERFSAKLVAAALSRMPLNQDPNYNRSLP